MVVLSITSNLDNIVIDNYIFNSLFIFVGFSIIQFVDNFFLQPYIFSSSVKSHPLEVFIVIIFSGILFGIFGLIIAIPLYTTLKVIFVSFFDIRKILSNLVK
jgi:predicted PurR-regulated permease PerM